MLLCKRLVSERLVLLVSNCWESVRLAVYPSSERAALSAASSSSFAPAAGTALASEATIIAVAPVFSSRTAVPLPLEQHPAKRVPMPL